MKVSSASADAFCRAAPQRARMALVYGPDRGLVQERVKLIREAVFGTEFDPMNHVRFTADEVEADPTRLVDEARALSLHRRPSAGRRQLPVAAAVVQTPSVGRLPDHF